MRKFLDCERQFAEWRKPCSAADANVRKWDKRKTYIGLQ
jgi:hypothetical protein